MADHDARASGHDPAVTPSEPGDPEWTVTLPESQTVTECTNDGERVYFGVLDYGATPAETSVVARSVDDGVVEWSVPTPYDRLAPPALGPGPDGEPTVFVASGQDNSNTGPGHGVVRTYDPATGDERWEWSAGSELGGIVVVEGSVVVTTVSLDHVAVHVLDAAEGTEQWSFPAKGWLHNTPTVHDGTVYLSSAREELAALHLADGEVRWRTETRADSSRPVVDRYRDLVYMGHRRGLEAFALGDGDKEWDCITTAPHTPDEDYLGVVDEPVVMDDRLVLRTVDTSHFYVGDVGHCYGVDPDTGTKSWQLPDGRPASTLVGAGNRVILRRSDSASAITPYLPGDPDLDPDAAALVAVNADGSVAWERPGLWEPVATGGERLFAYRGPTTSLSGIVDIACFSMA